MIPRYSCQNGVMGMIPQELTPQIQRTRQILIAFKHSILSRIAQSYHALKSLYLRTYHIISFDAQTIKHIEYHRSSRGLTMRTANYDTNLILGLLIQIFRERIYLQPQLTSTNQLRIIFASMHA